MTQYPLRTRLLGVTAMVALLLAGCAQPGDTITEIETGENGTKIETQDDREFYFRRGLDDICDPGDRLWECASRADLLIERKRVEPLSLPFDNRNTFQQSEKVDRRVIRPGAVSSRDTAGPLRWLHLNTCPPATLYTVVVQGQINRADIAGSVLFPGDEVSGQPADLIAHRVTPASVHDLLVTHGGYSSHCLA